MNQTEIGEFRKFLVPDALNQYEKLHPDLFKPRTPPAKTTPLRKGMRQDIPVDNNLSIVQDFLNLLPDLFVTPAYATTTCDECDSMVRDCKRIVVDANGGNLGVVLQTWMYKFICMVLCRLCACGTYGMRILSQILKFFRMNHYK